MPFKTFVKIRDEKSGSTFRMSLELGKMPFFEFLERISEYLEKKQYAPKTPKTKK